MAMRLSGLMSGMDTESIISQLVEARRVKVTQTIKKQKSLEFKQEAWKELNSKIVKLYNGAISNMRFESSYLKKTTKVSDSSVASVITGEGAMNSVQSLTVSYLAKSGYLTGAEIEGSADVKDSTKLSELGVDASGKVSITVGGKTQEIQVDGNTTVSSFVKSLQSAGVSANFDEVNQRFFIASKSSGLEYDFTLVGNDENGLAALKALGLSYVDSAVVNQYNDIIAANNAIIDDNNAIIATNTEIVNNRDNTLATKLQEKLDELIAKRAELQAAGDTEGLAAVEAQLSITTDDGGNEVVALSDAVATNIETDVDVEVAVAQGKIDAAQDKIVTAQENIASAQSTLAKLQSGSGVSGAKKEAGDDAKITLNGVDYTSSKNSFEINGLTLTVSSTTDPGEVVTITTEDDTEGIYDMVKNFFKEYNSLINEMDKLYNAESATKYEPLTDEEKDAMSETEVEKWETKIKDSILRKDSSLSTISGAMKEIMMSGVEIDGKSVYLSDFGIETLSYFVAPENEKNAYHIAGDPDDKDTSGHADKLKSAIANDPDKVVDFFTELSRKLYSRMTDLMSSTDYSSSYTVYDDKKMKEDYDDYTSKITELEEKLADYEDKWYAKFAAMETAMAKMQQNASAVTGLLGY